MAKPHSQRRNPARVPHLVLERDRATILSVAKKTAADLRTLAVTFNEHISNRDSDGLASLMTDDHTFIDTAGHVICGKASCLEAWRGFLRRSPTIETSLSGCRA